MKKAIVLLIMMVAGWTQAQTSELVTLYDNYSGKEGYTSVHITQYMFDLFRSIETEGQESEFQEVVTDLNTIKILSVDSVTAQHRSHSFVQEVLSHLPDEHYKELMVVKDGAETVRFMIREEGKKISEFLMMVDEPSGPVLIILEGDIDLNKLSKLSRSMNLNGFEHLQKVEEKQK